MAAGAFIGQGGTESERSGFAMYQRVIIAGNLGGDPVMRYTQDGTPVTSFSVATNEVWSDRETGDKRKRTTWWRVSAWRKQAEICNEYLSKGSQVLVEGTMAADPDTGGPRLWKTQDGQTRASFEVTAQVVRFIGGRGGAAAGAGGDVEEELPANEDALPF
jgi:single-strand DNA-binding protein